MRADIKITLSDILYFRKDPNTSLQAPVEGKASLALTMDSNDSDFLSTLENLLTDRLGALLVTAKCALETAKDNEKDDFEAELAAEAEALAERLRQPPAPVKPDDVPVKPDDVPVTPELPPANA